MHCLLFYPSYIQKYHGFTNGDGAPLVSILKMKMPQYHHSASKVEFTNMILLVP